MVSSVTWTTWPKHSGSFSSFWFSTLGSFEPRNSTVIPRNSSRGTRSFFDSGLHITCPRRTGRAKICSRTCSVCISETSYRGWNSLSITSTVSRRRRNSVAITTNWTNTEPRCILPSQYTTTRWRRRYSFSNLRSFSERCCFSWYFSTRFGEWTWTSAGSHWWVTWICQPTEKP